MKIIHIADVHWRGLTRHQEYKDSFSDMFRQCREIEPDCFLIAGDIVHSKTQGISPELIDCLNWWFTEMSRIAPVHVTLGNHDGLVLNHDRQDAISPILRALNLHNVYLYRDSGVYPDEKLNVNWCVFSPFDEEGYKSVKPKNDGRINIATYHGAVWGSHTDMNWMLEGDTKMDLFKGFDFTMLGDIHKRQAMDVEKRVWYPGSTIQQNYGETPEKGFLLWEIEDKNNFNVKFFPMKHNNPFVTIDFDKNVQNTVLKCKSFPSGSRFRIRSQKQLDPKTQRSLSNVLRREFNADEVVYKVDIDASAEAILKEHRSKMQIDDLHDVETHKTLLREYVGDEIGEIDFWPQVDKIMEDVLNTIEKREKMGKKWRVKSLKFSNTFGYGENNVINFDNLSGIVGLFGKNRSGKSSIPGTLMYALYNTNDRGISSAAHVINTREDFCNATAVFTVNGKLYELERQSTRYPSRGKRNSGACTYLNLFELDEDGTRIKDLSDEQRKSTEKVLRSLIGQSEEFMMTSFAAQGNMNAFISKGPTDRKKIMSNFLGLDVFDEIHRLIKEEGSGIKALLRKTNPKDWVVEIQNEKKKLAKLEDKRELLRNEVWDMNKQLEELKIAVKSSSDSYVDPDIIQKTKSSIKTIKGKIQDLTAGIEDKEATLDNLFKNIEKYEAIKEKFPIENIKRQYDSLINLEKTVNSLSHKLDKEQNTFNFQQKSASLLSEVPCGDKFPTCKFIAESHRNKKLLESQNSLIDNITSELDKFRNELNGLQSIGLKNKLNKYEKMLADEAKVKVKIADIQGKIKFSSTKLSQMKKDLEARENKLTKLLALSEQNNSEETKKVLNRIQQYENQRDEKNNQFQSLSEKIGNARKTIENLQEDRKRYDDLQVEFKVYDFLMKATSYRGVPTYIMSRQIPAINAELNSILQDISGFTVDIEVDEKNTDVYINYGDSRRPIECASGMEKMVSSMALRVALSNVSSLNRSDMFIVDEGFGALDPQNVEAVTTLLHSLKKFYRLILIISHVDVIKDSVDNIVEITKSGKNSKVVYE